MPKTKISQAVEKEVATENEVNESKDRKELEELRAKLAERDKEMADLKTMMLSLMAAQQGNSGTKSGEDEGYIYINNNSVGPINFVLDSEGKSQYYIEAGIQGRPISKEDISLALKVGTMRKLFELGVLEFVDENNYKKYGIIRLFDLSADNVVNMLSPDNIADNYKDLENLIKVRKERTLEHELCYKALDLVEKGRLPRNEESSTIIYLNRLFCSNRTATFLGLLSSLPLKRGDWKTR